MAFAAPQTNHTAGQTSPNIRGRVDLQIYLNSLEVCRNFRPDTQGQLRYRNGTNYISPTAGWDYGRLLTFEFSTEQAYALEFTEGNMRVFRDQGLVLETSSTNITDFQQNSGTTVVSTNPSAHGLSSGDLVYITDVGGLPEVNGRVYYVSVIDSTSFYAQELNGSDLSQAWWGDYDFGTHVYTSGGTVTKVVQVTTPFTESDLFEFEFDSTNDTMYLAHGDHCPQKLTRTAHSSWSITDVEFIDGPYLPENDTTTTLTLSGTSGSVTVTASATTGINSDTGFQSTDVGRLIRYYDGTDWHYLKITAYTSTTVVTADIKNGPTGSSSAQTKWRLGAFSDTTGWPYAVAFHENRLFYGGNDTLPQGVWGSRGAEVDSDFDNFTPGTEEDDAVSYLISSSNRIRWLKSTPDFLAIGTHGAEYRMTGASSDEPITVTSVSVKPVSYNGVAQISPVVLESHIIFPQRDYSTIRSMEYNALNDRYVSVNRSLASEYITKDGIAQMDYERGKNNVVWIVENGGNLVGMLFEPQQEVIGYFEVNMDGGTIESVCAVPQDRGSDILHMIVKRTIDGTTRRYVETFNPDQIYPLRDDYYTGVQATDSAAFLQDMYEAQKRAVHLDSAVVYDGSQQSVTMTPGATTGTSVSFTAGGSVFSSDDVGREIHGANGGRAEIVTYNSSTSVTCDIFEDFPATTVMDVGEWYLTTNFVRGLFHLEGETVTARCDGITVRKNGDADLVVDDFALTFDKQYSYIIIGKEYTGIAKLMPIEPGSRMGTSVTKKKKISQFGVRLLNSLGLRAGTSMYNLMRMDFGTATNPTERPAPLYTGDMRNVISGNWASDQSIYLMQKEPQPCTVQVNVPYLDVSEL